MKYDVETLNPTRVKLSVEVPFDELKPSLDAAYRRIAGQINVPGFRRGKVPSMVIDQRVGRINVIIDAVNEALPEFYMKAMAENDLQPLSQPELDVDPIDEDVPVVFRAEVDVVPKIELPEFHGIQAEVDDIEVDDSTVDDGIDELRQRFASLDPVERPAADGDYVTIDLSAAKDGEPVDDAQASGISYQVGSGGGVKGLDEALLGMSAGEDKEFESTLAGGGHEDEAVTITVRVGAVKEQQLPELDDEFAELASEFDTIEELRADIAEKALRNARMRQADQAREAVMDVLLGAVEIPLPEQVVIDQVDSRRERIKTQLEYAGISEHDYLQTLDRSEEDFVAELEKESRRAIATQFVMDEIVKVEQIGVEQEELTSHLVQMAMESGVDPAEYAKHAVEHDHLSEHFADIQRRKAISHVMESAKVTDKSGNPVELATLLRDGTYGVVADEPADGAGQQAGSVTTTTDAAGGLVVAGEYIEVDE